jgi:hypothetical protein
MIQFLSLFHQMGSREALGRSRRNRLKAGVNAADSASGRRAGNYLLVLGLMGSAAWTSRNVALVILDTVAETDQRHQYCS